MIPHKCYICGASKRGGATKKLVSEHDQVFWICSKGKCRRLYDCDKDMVAEYGLIEVLEVCKALHGWAE